MNRSLALLLFAAACTDPSGSGPTEIKSNLPRDMNPAVTDTELAELVTGNTAFAADLYRQVRTRPGNLFMSPHSISTTLAMTYAGAAGNTATQMATALHFTLPPAKLHAAQDALDLALASRAAAATGNTIPFRLKTASSIWGQQGKTFQPAFLDTLAVNYGAGLHVLDFATDPDGSRDAINGWVEDRTNDKIKDLLPDGSITDLTRLVLTNAIYFSAAWDDPFEPAQTTDRAFLANGTQSVQVPTLYQNGAYGYAAGAGFRAAELPYDGNLLSMVVVVPDDLASFEASLDGAKLTQITSALEPAAVDLTLPKFKFDAPLGLAEVLKNLGMTDAFGAAADLSGIDGTRDLVITDVVHKGFVAIDEKGTEAAAATAVIVGDTSAPLPQTLHVDRPFLILIRDIPTGAILFIGRVVDPR
ncbi:MAG: serpin family protein [Deltaproteobacteria bacterium]|nr:serpin family protein [Deltaproteobacteria bacterium]MDQ3300853.1 serpin family protein [Myxococcota bacterium]